MTDYFTIMQKFYYLYRSAAGIVYEETDGELMKKNFLCVVFLCCAGSIFAGGIGSDAAYPQIEPILKTIPFTSGEMYELTENEVEQLVGTCAEIEINLFELLDCTYRYVSQHNFRGKISGTALQSLTSTYCIAEGTLAQLLPITKLDYLEIGVPFTDGQNALDVFLSEEHVADLEIGLGYYETHFGFKKISPRLFSQAFGLRVKANIFGIRGTASKIKLYENGKGAFYIKGFYKPKRWNLSLVRKLENVDESERLNSQLN